MNPLKNNPDNEWRKAFEKASETPPPEAWDAIEKQLDADKPVMPWWKSRRAWLAAASIFLFLGLGTALILNNKTDRKDGAVTGETEMQLPETEAFPAEKTTETEILSAPENASQKTGANEDASRENRLVENSAPVAGTAASYPAKTIQAKSAPTETRSVVAVSDVTSSIVEEVSDADVRRQTQIALTPIEPQAVREIKIYWQTRYVFYTDPSSQLAGKTESVAKKSPLWAGVSLMPGGFLPNLKYAPQPVYNAMSSPNAGVLNSFASAKQVSTEHRDTPRMSMTASAQVGFELNRRWTLESGVSYLQGNAISYSPGFLMDRTSRTTADFLSNALMSGGANYSTETFGNFRYSEKNDGSSVVFVPMDKSMNNTYSYLQVPAYVGYTIRPDKKLSYTILGGAVSNIFLKNKLESASGYALTTTRENQVYNNLTLSAATGIRLNYRLDRSWNTHLTGNYQQSVMNNFKDNRFLSSRPQFYGVSWGVRYTFQK